MLRANVRAIAVDAAGAHRNAAGTRPEAVQAPNRTLDVTERHEVVAVPGFWHGVPHVAHARAPGHARRARLPAIRQNARLRARLSAAHAPHGRATVHSPRLCAGHALLERLQSIIGPLKVAAEVEQAQQAGQVALGLVNNAVEIVDVMGDGTANKARLCSHVLPVLKG